ncbi:MAG: hypothetical protein AB9842_10235 [Bacteroidales bacterium]
MKKSIVIALFIPLFFMALPKNGTSQTMSIAPDIINLNTQGYYDDIQCIYGGVIPSGYTITGHNITITLEGIFINLANGVDYCPIDNNIFVLINRANFQNNPVVRSFANAGTKVLSVSGTFTVTNITGDQIVYPVNRWGYIEIIQPGKKK